jgi:inhibitor of cysteine peptidase
VIRLKNTVFILFVGCLVILAAGLTAGCIGATTPASDSQTKTTVTPADVAPVTTTAVSTKVATIVPTAVSTVASSSVNTVFVNSTANGEILTIPADYHVVVRLKENPTTGYVWNATASKGLSIISNTYTAPDTGLIGAGGYREWILAPDTVDTYTFKAVSLRPWVGATADDETFSLVIVATPE